MLVWLGMRSRVIAIVLSLPTSCTLVLGSRLGRRLCSRCGRRRCGRSCRGWWCYSGLVGSGCIVSRLGRDWSSVHVVVREYQKVASFRYW